MTGWAGRRAIRSKPDLCTSVHRCHFVSVAQSIFSSVHHRRNPGAAMSDRAFVATRKGLFTLERTANGRAHWAVKDVAFLGDNCPMFLPDERDGTLYAALSHGHFGSKFHRSPDA